MGEIAAINQMEQERNKRYLSGGRYYLHYYYSDYPGASSFASDIERWKQEDVYTNQLKKIKERKNQIAERAGYSGDKGEAFWDDIYRMSKDSMEEMFNSAISGGLYESQNGNDASFELYSNQIMLGKAITDITEALKKTTNINKNLSDLSPLIDQLMEAMIPNENDRKILSDAMLALCINREISDSSQNQSTISKRFLQNFIASKSSQRDKMFVIEDSAISGLDSLTQKKIQAMTAVEKKILSLTVALRSMISGGETFSFEEESYYNGSGKAEDKITSGTLNTFLNKFFVDLKQYAFNMGKATFEISTKICLDMVMEKFKEKYGETHNSIGKSHALGEGYGSVSVNMKDDDIIAEMFSVSGARSYNTKKSKPDTGIDITASGDSGTVVGTVGFSVKQAKRLSDFLDSEGNFTSIGQRMSIKLQDSTPLSVLLVRELGMNDDEMRGLLNLAVGKGDDAGPLKKQNKLFVTSKLNNLWDNFFDYVRKKSLLPALTGMLYGSKFNNGDSLIGSGEAYFMIINKTVVSVEDIIESVINKGSTVGIRKNLIPTRKSFSDLNKWVEIGKSSEVEAIQRSKNLFQEASTKLYNAKIRIDLTISKNQALLFGI